MLLSVLGMTSRILIFPNSVFKYDRSGSDLAAFIGDPSFLRGLINEKSRPCGFGT